MPWAQVKLPSQASKYLPRCKVSINNGCYFPTADGLAPTESPYQTYLKDVKAMKLWKEVHFVVDEGWSSKYYAALSSNEAGNSLLSTLLVITVGV